MAKPKEGGVNEVKDDAFKKVIPFTIPLELNRPGRFKVEVTASGFETFATSDVQLTARQTVRVDATLSVGTLSEAVTVSSAGAIASETQTIASAIGPR